MSLLKDIQAYLILGFILFLLIIFLSVFLYVLYEKRKKETGEINYDHFMRKDSLEYLKFDEILSSSEDEFLKGAGVIVKNKNTFISGVMVSGLNFYVSSYQEQEHTIASMISLIDSLEYPISFRQSSKAIDISYNISMFNDILFNLTKKYEEGIKEEKRLINLADDNIDNENIANTYFNRYEVLKKKMEILKRQIDETNEMILYMKEISSLSSNTQQVNIIMFSYDYDERDFTYALSREEVIKEAMRVLDSRASSLINNLSRCGCAARRASAFEISDLLYRHMHPVTCDEDGIIKLFNTDISSLFVTSDTLKKVTGMRLFTKEEEEKINAEVKEKIKRESLKNKKSEDDLISKMEDKVRGISDVGNG